VDAVAKLPPIKPPPVEGNDGFGVGEGVGFLGSPEVGLVDALAKFPPIKLPPVGAGVEVVVDPVDVCALDAFNLLSKL
jgi:hypothetical protein